jgi:hypothetical protein
LKQNILGRKQKKKVSAEAYLLFSAKKGRYSIFCQKIQKAIFYFPKKLFPLSSTGK